jgi:hypothetical protein
VYWFNPYGQGYGLGPQYMAVTGQRPPWCPYRQSNPALAVPMAPRCDDDCALACLQKCSNKYCKQPDSTKAGYCGTIPFKSYVHCGAGCIRSKEGTKSPGVGGYLSANPHPATCDEDCLKACEKHCSDTTSGLADFTKCMSGCITGVDDGGLDPPEYAPGLGITAVPPHVQQVLAGGRVPGMTRSQRRAIRRAYRGAYR